MLTRTFPILTAFALCACSWADFRLVGVQPIRWGQSDGSVGFAGGTVENFEDATLAPGLSVEWLAPNGNIGPTSTLPALFANATDDPFGTAFSTGAWDGTRSLVSGRGNQSHPYSSSGDWGDVVLHFNPPVKMVGFSFEQAENEITMVVNGSTVGGAYGSTGLSVSSGRGGYVLLEARGTDSISTLKLDNGGGDGWCIDRLLYSIVGAPQVAVIGFSPAIWPRTDASLGFGGTTLIENFEDASLSSGLSIAWDTQAGLTSPTTTLPNAFEPVTQDPFGNAFDLGAWDGAHCVINTRDNLSHPYTGTGEWGDIEFLFNPPVRSVGFSLEDHEAPARLVINGRDTGSIPALSGTPLVSSGRNGYIRIDAPCGSSLSSVRLNNARGANGGDGFAIDHLMAGVNACDCIDFNQDGLFPDVQDIDDFLSVFAGGPCSNDPNCGDIDFNNDTLFPDTLDIDSLLSVFSGGPCL